MPHMVVLSPAFYEAKLRPLLAEWLLLWLRRQGLRDISDAQIVECLAGGGADASMQNSLSDRQV